MREKSEMELLCKRLGITCDAMLYGAEPNPEFKDSFAYRVKLKFQGRTLATDFYCGRGHVTKPYGGGPPVPKPPSAADVLSCLCSDVRSVEFDSFEAWASEMGMDADSRRAERIYKACEAMAPKLRRFLGDSFEDVCKAEH